jgi:hypothetical protein
MESNEIRVMVNNVLDKIGSATARNVLKMPDMCLLPVSITTCGTYRKASIDQFKIKLFDPSFVVDNSFELSPLFEHGQPDVIVDLNLKSVLRNQIPLYLNVGTAFILNACDAQNISKMINSLSVNVALIPDTASEKEILMTIRFLYQKSKERVSGKVFKLSEIAA